MTEANKILGESITFIGAQNMAIVAMLRALYASHPEHEKVKEGFDQLIAQNLAHPACLDDPKNAKTLREMSELLTRPKVYLD